MSTGNPSELGRIAETDDLYISPFREDGETYRTPTWIWSVVVDDSLYVRAYDGTSFRITSPVRRWGLASQPAPRKGPTRRVKRTGDRAPVSGDQNN